MSAPLGLVNVARLTVPEEAHVVGLLLRSCISLDTRKTYGQGVQTFTRWSSAYLPGLPLASLTMEHALDYRDYLISRYGNGTAATYLASVKALYRLMLSLRCVAVDPWVLVKGPKVSTLSQTVALTNAEMASHGTRMEGWSARNALVYRLLYEAGLRRAEVSALPLDCIENTREGPAIRLVGKGAKERLVGISADLTEKIRQQAVRSEGKSTLLQLRPGSINALLKRSLGNVHPHQLRHTHVTVAVERGADLLDIGVTVGHADPRTTKRYVTARNAVARSSARLVALRQFETPHEIRI